MSAANGVDSSDWIYASFGLLVVVVPSLVLTFYRRLITHPRGNPKTIAEVIIPTIDAKNALNQSFAISFLFSIWLKRR